MKIAYVYMAKNGPGSIVRGTLTASNVNDALTELMKGGLVPIEIAVKEAESGLSSSIRMGAAVRRSDIALFTRQLANLIDCDVTMMQSLRMIAKRSRKPAVRNLLDDLCRRIADGHMLSEALTAYPKLFTTSYVHMVRSGELGGQLGGVLRVIVNLIDEDESRKAQIKGALYYPLFVLGVGILAIVVMLTFVVPRMAGLFGELRAELPWPTNVLMYVSGFLGDQWAVLLIAAAAVLGCGQAWMRSTQAKEQCDTMILRLPFYGNFIRQTETGNFLRTLGMLLENGVDTLSALSAARDVMGNSQLRKCLSEILNDVRAGSSLSLSVGRQTIFDDALAGLVQVGEESGDLSRSLKQAALMYERETALMSKAFLSLLGPVFLFVIVGFTGFVVAALLLPITQMDMMVR